MPRARGPAHARKQTHAARGKGEPVPPDRSLSERNPGSRVATLPGQASSPCNGGPERHSILSGRTREMVRSRKCVWTCSKHKKEGGALLILRIRPHGVLFQSQTHAPSRIFLRRTREHKPSQPDSLVTSKLSPPIFLPKEKPCPYLKAFPLRSASFIFPLPSFETRSAFRLLGAHILIEQIRKKRIPFG
ncbi:MAG: hypothetical protein RLZZ244_1729 [Verrucomicrobiota bacterium]